MTDPATVRPRTSRLLTAALVFAALALPAARVEAALRPLNDDADDPIEGRWSARESRGDRIRLELETGRRGRWSSTLEDPGLAAFLAGGAPAYSLRREAGRFELERDGGRPGGSFRFVPDPEFVRAMAARGFAGLSQRRLFELAALDVTTGLADGLAELGYDALSLDRLIEMRIHGSSWDWGSERD